MSPASKKKRIISTYQPLYEFHVSREGRNRYQFDEKLFAQTGNVIFLDFYQVRIFAEKMNRKRDLISSPESAIKAGSLNAMGLIDEILHYVVGLYKDQIDPAVFAEAEKWIQEKVGADILEKLLITFVDSFPPLSVYKGTHKAETYLKQKTAGISNRQLVLEEILLIHLANNNPAFSPFKELFDDQSLGKETAYQRIIFALEEFFAEKPVFGPDNQNIVKMLRTPSKKYPQSLSAQLEFIRKQWGYLLSKYIYRLLSGLDIIKEEEKPVFSGPGLTYLPDFGLLGAEDEPERFSRDLDWMPNVVMIAKSTYVWLDQLSKKYSRDITRLDHIPDEELNLIANRGFNALWFIGLWERSPASQKIKQMCGNPEAVSSAYSLYDYTIARDLGGESAYENLKERAWARGIRLASDMVPNHTGIFSKWVIEHPNWYVQADNQVFPGYSFNGPNLSEDDRVAIYIEDGYWNRSDAAVLFKRVDTYTGAVSYIYHGNDGTSMPWNDTAQLNYLLPDVREAVIQTILEVARNFPIIRLDAAMTLAKKHFHRLWFPQPGSGGDIPSRAGFAMTHEKFDELFPVEFWREVVDRVAKEVPDTLLLAEAFWMMEGYFVRTLGMHRVYNSAFMNMLKNEENQKYRQAIKSVMDFNPEIMKRYVNFMNNPDEETAIAQFGKEDKYFGVCILMATLPGLPMFGHGQIEGFKEKYGMEYRRAYWDEHEDEHLTQRHEREIFPLLKKRYLFSEVKNFILYDLVGSEGYVNEDVFVYTNRFGNEKALVVYNNRYERARGWIKYSSASAQKNKGGFKSYTLSEGLILSASDNYYTIFRDQTTNLEYIRNNAELSYHGLYVELDGFKYNVFLDFREIEDNEYGHYAQLASFLSGRGVPSIEEALKETFLTPVHQPFMQLLDTHFLNKIDKFLNAPGKGAPTEKELSDYFCTHFTEFIRQVKNYSSIDTDEKVIIKDQLKKFRYLIYLRKYPSFIGLRNSTQLQKTVNFLKDNAVSPLALLIWVIVSQLGKLQDKEYAAVISVSWMEEFLLSRIIEQSFIQNGYDDFSANRQLQLIKIIILLPDWMANAAENPGFAFQSLFQYQEVQKFLGVNLYQDVLYYNYESLVELLAAFYTMMVLNLSLDDKTEHKIIRKKLLDEYERIYNIFEIARDQGCRVHQTIEAVLEL